MSKVYLLILFLFSAYLALAQQPAQYSLYMMNNHAFNPSYAGMENSLIATGAFRSQWVGFVGQPINQQVNVHLPWYFASSGLGVNFENEQIGVEKNVSGSLSYAYHIELGKNTLFSTGLGVGLLQKTIDGTLLRAPEGAYEESTTTIDHQDGILPNTIVRAFAPRFDLGLSLKYKELYIGVSAGNITESTLKFDQTLENSIKLTRNYYLTASYGIKFGDKLYFRPSLFIKSDVVQTQVEISTLFDFNDNIIGGLSFRGYDNNTLDAFVIIAGFRFSEKYTIGYAYDLSVSSLRSFQSGSHEIVISYNLNRQIGGSIPSKIIYNPRF